MWSIGVDFKIKQLTIGGKRLKLTIWDPGNELNGMDLCFTFFMLSILKLDIESLDRLKKVIEPVGFGPLKDLCHQLASPVGNCFLVVDLLI